MVTKGYEKSSNRNTDISEIDRWQLSVYTNKGRIDAVIIDKDIYIFGFEFNGNKNKALNQIKEKNISKSIRALVKKFIFLVLNLPTEMWGNGLLRKERRDKDQKLAVREQR